MTGNYKQIPKRQQDVLKELFVSLDNMLNNLDEHDYGLALGCIGTIKHQLIKLISAMMMDVKDGEGGD